MNLRISRFNGKLDSLPKAAELPWEELRELLGYHERREAHDGPLWSPAHYPKGMRRANVSVEEICCLVLDFDKGQDPAPYLADWSRYTCAVHSSHSSTAETPRWRAVFPLARPVPADRWAEVYAKLIENLAPGATDPSCGDESRMYYLPACPARTYEERFFKWQDGQLLDESEFPDILVPEPPMPVHRPVPRNAASDELSPGDDFDARATWDEILEPHGWKVQRRGYAGGMTLWTRPGKKTSDGCSARTGIGTEGDRMVVWSSSTELPVMKPLKKYFVFAALNHNGDIQAAVRALAAKGYGSRKGSAASTSVIPFDPDEMFSDEGDADPEDQLEMDEEDGELIPGWEPGPKFRHTDLGNAKRMVFRHGDVLRYCADWDRWLVWNGFAWAEDAPSNPKARGYAHDVVEDLIRHKKSYSWGKSSQSSGKISAMIREAQALPGICVRFSELDTHDMLLACPNGVLDLRTGQLLEPRAELLITKAVTVPYDPDAKCPTFERFLVQVMKERKDLVDLLLRAMGYSLTGSTKEQSFFLLYGERGRNGKSTLMDLLQDLLGEGLCFTIRKKLLTDSDADSARFAKASIEGKRLVYANETKKGARLDTEFIKEFIGGHKMDAERKGKDPYQFSIKAKFWYAVNSLPGADFDNSFRSRVIPIPFEQSFYPEGDKEFEDGDLPPDRDLPDKLRAELPGVLSLLVRGCLRWQEQGGLGAPEEVRVLKDKYETENDHVALWIEERCEFHPDARERASVLFEDFTAFAKKMRLRGFGRVNEFVNRLKREPGVEHIMPKNKSTFTGIQLVGAEPQGSLGGLD